MIKEPAKRSIDYCNLQKTNDSNKIRSKKIIDCGGGKKDKSRRVYLESQLREEEAFDNGGVYKDETDTVMSKMNLL